MVKPKVLIVLAKTTLTCNNCGKIHHLVETCHNKKREVLVIPTAIIKSAKLVTWTKTQPIKLGRIPLCYPYITWYNAEHRYGKCPKKIEV